MSHFLLQRLEHFRGWRLRRRQVNAPHLGTQRVEWRDGGAELLDGGDAGRIKGGKSRWVSRHG
ncbi:hypothetical protein QWY74_00815 [Halomonas almeriensis]|nr:hypothetical protein [Halomonas almeriensis]MDN3552022.1 hypothetical protein [Halomonas almeriensis]